MNLRPAVIASATFASGDALILRSAPWRASRRMAARGPWFETALARLTMRFPLQLAMTAAAFASGGVLILRSAPLRASRRMAARGPWFETALTRLLTMRSALQLEMTASAQRQTNEHER